ncbi:MAG: hypothetical protein Ct9H300mP1_32560 [Planctomycetaceae bacterium]|nr:MAG: hypothetical protein Ct9H300mP1_32560 [Planctomycetaceae bacterium]
MMSSRPLRPSFRMVVLCWRMPFSESEAAELAELVLSSPTRSPGVSGYEFVVCLMNHDLRFLKLAMHPTVLELARHQLGGRTEPAPNAFAWPVEHQILLGSVDGLVAHSGSDPGWWHMDSPRGPTKPKSRPLPDFPFPGKTDLDADPFFREETGRPACCREASTSATFRRQPGKALEGQLTVVLRPVALSCCQTPSGTPAGTNQTQQPRVAVACNYQPWWVGRLTMDAYPFDREVWEKMPPEAQALTRHQLEWNTDFSGELTDTSAPEK